MYVCMYVCMHLLTYTYMDTFPFDLRGVKVAYIYIQICIYFQKEFLWYVPYK